MVGREGRRREWSGNGGGLVSEVGQQSRGMKEREKMADWKEREADGWS